MVWRQKTHSEFIFGTYDKIIEALYNGVQFYVKDIDENITVRGVISCGTADLPAKALFLAMNQYNGRFGCQVCLHEGVTVERTRTYPFKESTYLRTEDNVIESSLQALEMNKPVCGVKGPTIMSKICQNFITSTAIDIMHCVFEGVAKKLIELWFDVRFSEERFNISDLVDIVDDKLSKIEPPSYIVRRPRSIKSHFKYWKASELKNWFFYFFVPILHNILPCDYLYHYQHIVLATYLLCTEQITNEAIALAEQLIVEFLRQFEYFYGQKYMACNVHSLLHLPEIVRRLGPLWTTSCFLLKDVNGKIKNLVHSTKNPELQIMSNLNLYLRAHLLKYDWLKENTDAYVFCEILFRTKRRLKLTQIEQFTYVVGTASQIDSSKAAHILTENQLIGTNVFLFKKIYTKKWYLLLN